jgi:putative oxidoreductase
MTMASGEPKLVVPAFGGVYRATFDLWYPLIRIATGGLLLVHGWGKLQGGVGPVAANMDKLGAHPAVLFGYFIIFLETVGALCVAVGLFTRVFAAAIAIEMAVITFAVMMPNGFGRMEYTLLWGILFLAIALRGGGPYSLDRKIGWEI